MTTKNNNTPDSGLLELSKIRASIAEASGADKAHDPSLLTEHVPALRADKPQRSRLSALGVAVAASMVLGVTSAAYALHHQVTQHMFRATVVATTQQPGAQKPRLEPAVSRVAPQPMEVRTPPQAPEPQDLELPAPVSSASTSTARSSRVRAPAGRASSVRRSSSSPSDSSDSTSRSIDALLHAATGGQVTPREGATRPAPSRLPERPERAHVSTSFRSISSVVRACSEGAEGVVSARASVDGATGRVRSVSLSGGELSPSAAQCVERALLGVRLDPFQQNRLEITFPYRL